MASPAPVPDLPLALADIEAAAERIAGAVVRTPTLLSGPLSDRFGASIWVKFENLQRTGSFKDRGALNKLLLMDEATRARGVIAASAGNHAQAVAWHASRLDVPAVIVMPRSTPTVKVSQTEAYGAEVVLHGSVYDEAFAEAMRIAKARKLTYINAFDDPEVMAGQGTVALEMLADAPGLDLLVVPIGGGGLMSGMAVAAKALKPGIEIAGVQAELYPAMFARYSRQPMTCAGDTIAEGIAMKMVGQLTPLIVEALVDDIWLAAERDLEAGVSLLARTEKTVAEGAGAAAIAALLVDPERARGRNVGIVVTGGNIDQHLLANVLLRDLARSGRMTRLRIDFQDRPGALLEAMKLFSAHQVNIVEVFHERVYTHLPAKDTAIDLECEARDAAQIERLTHALRGEGFSVRRLGIE
ncbi:MAG: threonine ammonia-lyase [Sphingosinicella sp.]